MSDFPPIVYVDQQMPDTATGHRRWLLIGIREDTWVEYGSGETFTWQQVCGLGTPVRLVPESDPSPGADVRPFAELRDSGLLWLINRVVFHPRGYALALTVRDGEAVGWKLLGDGSEVWRFDGDEDRQFERVRRTFAEVSEHVSADSPVEPSPEAEAAMRANIGCVSCRDEDLAAPCTCAFRCGWNNCGLDINAQIMRAALAGSVRGGTITPAIIDETLNRMWAEGREYRP